MTPDAKLPHADRALSGAAPGEAETPRSAHSDAPHAVVGSLAELPRWFPPWAAQLGELYFSGTTSAFVLHGNT